MFPFSIFLYLPSTQTISSFISFSFSVLRSCFYTSASTKQPGSWLSAAMSRHGKSLNSKPLHTSEREMQPPESLVFSVPHWPPFHSWNTSDLWDHGKNAVQKLRAHRAHFELGCPSFLFVAIGSSCKCLEWRGGGNRRRAAKQTHDLNSFPSLTEAAWAKNFTCLREKAKYMERSFGKFSDSFMFSSRAVNLSASTPNPLTRRWKTLTIKCLCILWGQIILQWLFHIFWTQTLHWCHGKKPQTHGSQG